MWNLIPPDTLAWLLVTVAALVVEGLTVSLVSIWFAIGGAAALLTSLLGGSVPVQIAAFVVISAAALALTKPLVDKARRAPTVPTNADRNIGRAGTVLADIPAGRTGRVRLDGVDWTARSADGAPLPAGTACRVVALESTVLVVVPEPARAPAPPCTRA